MLSFGLVNIVLPTIPITRFMIVVIGTDIMIASSIILLRAVIDWPRISANIGGIEEWTKYSVIGNAAYIIKCRELGG